MGVRGSSAPQVFINVPFDRAYERQYLALIAGLLTLGLTPRSVVEIQTSKDRLTRLLGLIRGCQYSHDLSRVQLSRGPRFSVPRFNMPFELGLAVGVALEYKGHEWRALEAEDHRVNQSLSDIDGYDAAIHGGTVSGMFEALLDVFGHRGRVSPETKLDMYRVYRGLAQFRKKLTRAIYRPEAFRQLVLAGRALAADERAR